MSKLCFERSRHRAQERSDHGSEEGVTDLGPWGRRGGCRREEAERSRGADGAEELLADAGEVHAAALDQEEGQEDERARPGLEQLLAAEEGRRGRGGG